jgi:hypothetical protein
MLKKENFAFNQTYETENKVFKMEQEPSQYNDAAMATTSKSIEQQQDFQPTKIHPFFIEIKNQYSQKIYYHKYLGS